MHIIYLVTSLILVSACRATIPSSETRGHFEEGSESELVAYRNRVKAIPEYRPSQAVILSPILFSSLGLDEGQKFVKGIVDAGAEIWMASNEYEDADAAIADLGLESQYTRSIRKLSTTLLRRPGQLVYWTRDYAPIGASVDDELLLLDFNYFSWARQQNDAIPRHFSSALGLPRVSLPIYLEGGNFMVNDDGVCVMSERVVTANATVQMEGDMIWSRSDIEDYMRKYAGCNDVIMTAELPREGTGHIDIWIKFLDNNTVVIADIPQTAIDSVAGPIADIAADMRDFLNDQADFFQRRFSVKRVKVGPPMFGTMGHVTLPSYTNALFVNGTAFVPTYSTDENSSQFEALDRDAAVVFRQHGFRVVQINTTGILDGGGSIHCASMQVPKIGQGSIDGENDQAGDDSFVGCYEIKGAVTDGRYEGGRERLCIERSNRQIRFNFFHNPTFDEEDYIVLASLALTQPRCPDCIRFENSSMTLNLAPSDNGEKRLTIDHRGEDADNQWGFTLSPQVDPQTDASRSIAEVRCADDSGVRLVIIKRSRDDPPTSMYHVDLLLRRQRQHHLTIIDAPVTANDGSQFMVQGSRDREGGRVRIEVAAGVDWTGGNPKGFYRVYEDSSPTIELNLNHCSVTYGN